MMTGKEQLIREAAYRIWEEEGHPTGDADRHWEMAARRIEAADGESARSPLDSKATSPRPERRRSRLSNRRRRLPPRSANRRSSPNPASALLRSKGTGEG